MNRFRMIAALALIYVVFAILLNSVGTVILQSIATFGIDKPEASSLERYKDLTIAFGNPFLHHPDPARQYLASDSEPATVLRESLVTPVTAMSDRAALPTGRPSSRVPRRRPSAVSRATRSPRGRAVALAAGRSGDVIGP